MKHLLVIIAAVALGCDAAHDAGQCDYYAYSGVLDEHGQVELDLDISVDDPFILDGWALIDHTEFKTWEPLSVEIDTNGQVFAWSHGGTDAEYRLTLMECVK